MVFDSLKKFVGGSDYSQAEDYVEIDASDLFGDDVEVDEDGNIILDEEDFNEDDDTVDDDEDTTDDEDTSDEEGTDEGTTEDDTDETE